VAARATWFPSCVVNLRLRFDEAFQIVDLPEPGPQGGDPNSVEVPAATSSRGTQGSGFTGGSRPLITQTGSDNLSFVMDRVPKTAQVEIPGYRQAGKFSLEFDWRELPIDPRLVRSCGVEIYFGAVSAEDFSTGMTRVEADGSRRSILRTSADDGSPRDDLMTLAGIADSWTISHSGESSMVKMEGRDLRGVFLDSPIDPAVAGKLDLSKSLDLVVLDILKGHPAAAYMHIVFSPDDWPNGAPPSVLDREGLTRVRRKADGEGQSSSGQDDKLTVWDLITRYCFLVGAVPYFRGRTLVLRPSVSLFDQSKPKFSSADKVFDPVMRVDDDGNPFTTRRMILGGNIKELTFERKLAGVKVPIIEVVSLDTSSKQRGGGKLLIAQFPPASQQAASNTDVYPSGQASQTDKLVIPVPGIRDQVRLNQIAQALFEEIGRGEMGGSCKTSQLASFKGTNLDPDLLRIRPGDVVEFQVDTRQVGAHLPGASTYSDSFRLSFDEQVKRVMEALSGKSGHGDANLARVIVASSRSSIVDLLRSFRTANVVFNWANTSGIGISFDFQNYFIVRYGVTAQTGQNTTKVKDHTINSSTAHRPKIKVVSKASVKSAPKGPNTSVKSIHSPKGRKK
jgi:hypothetical protein